MTLRLPTLFAKKATGKILLWRIFVKGNSYYTLTGQRDGAQTQSANTVCQGKNTGRTNATTPKQQAYAEALAQWEEKQRSGGYWLNLKDVDKQRFVAPMLAYKFADYQHKIKYPVMVDRKYNGMRQETISSGPKTRKGEIVLSAPHIFEEAQKLFRHFPNLVLDGELYNHKLRYELNELISIVRTRKKSKLTPAFFERSREIVRYYVYDAYGFKNITQETGCLKRRKALQELLQGFKYLVPVPFDVAGDFEALQRLYEGHLNDGYEGSIIRNIDAPYQNKRTKDLLKLKPEDDDEFEIVDIREGEGNWAGAAKIVFLRALKDAYHNKKLMHKKGTEFRGGVKGSYNSGVKILRDKRKWIGKTVTITYNGFTGKGTPNYAQLNPNNCFKGDR